jgi:hypothetical protein
MRRLLLRAGLGDQRLVGRDAEEPAIAERSDHHAQSLRRGPAQVSDRIWIGELDLRVIGGLERAADGSEDQQHHRGEDQVDEQERGSGELE